MATTTLIIVILALLGTFTVVILPCSKFTKAVLCGMIGVVFMVAAIIKNAQTYPVPNLICEKIRTAPTIEARQYLMTRFNVSEAALSIKAENELSTPLEIFGGCLTALGLILSLVLVVAVRNCNDEEAGQTYKVVQLLTLSAVIYLLSLYMGLQLSIIAWIKNKKSLVAKPSPKMALEKSF